MNCNFDTEIQARTRARVMVFVMPLSTILQLYDLLERGCRWFHQFFVDFQSFYFLSRIIPAYNMIIYGMNYHSDMQLQVFTND